MNAGATPLTVGTSATNTVPLSWARVGELVELSVAVTHGGEVLVGPVVGVTGCHAPTPLLATGFHHCNDVPPPRSQSWRVTEVNADPEPTAASKNVPPVEKEGVPTGLDPYWPTLTEPAPPEPVTVMEPLVSVDVATAGDEPVEVAVLQLFRLVHDGGVLPGMT